MGGGGGGGGFYIHIAHTIVFPKYLAGIHSQTQHINSL
jgi:hypothetical protein